MNNPIDEGALLERVTLDAGVLAGKPTLRGSRVSVAQIVTA